MTHDPSRKVLTVVGGGVHVVSLLDALAARDDVPQFDVRLVARDSERLAIIGRHARAHAAIVRPEWSVEWTTDLAQGVSDADVVVLLVRVGGGAARAYDERFPSVCGLVGDEGIGAGGISNAWRTAPVLRDMARVISDAAPNAMVLNMVAPLGVTTRVLLDAGVAAVGVCELPTVVMDKLVSAGATASVLSVGGLNHLSWVWPTDTESASDANGLLKAALECGAVDSATFDRFGGVPMPYYFRVADPATGDDLGIRQPAGRAGQLSELSDRALARMETTPGETISELAERPTPWFDLATVPVLAAWCGGQSWKGTLNVRNDNRFAALDADLVVEVPATVGAGVVAAAHPSPRPAPIDDFLSGWAHTEVLTYDAVTTRDPAALKRAMLSLPLGLSADDADVLTQCVLNPTEDVA